jgi:hypothetical protein
LAPVLHLQQHELGRSLPLRTEPRVSPTPVVNHSSLRSGHPSTTGTLLVLRWWWWWSSSHACTLYFHYDDYGAPTLPTIQQDEVEATTEGEVVSRREAPRRIQVDHLPSRIIGDINERTTGRGTEKLLTLLIQLLLLPLSQKTLDTLFLILIRWMPCMRS